MRRWTGTASTSGSSHIAVGSDHYTFTSPGIRVVAGVGSLAMLSTEIAARGDDVVLLIADALMTHPLAKRAAGSLDVDAADVIEVGARPSPVLLDAYVARGQRPSVVVALGGGATMDAAKALAARLDVPRIAVIPTTFAGASVTPAAALYEGNELVRISGPALAPSLVILDPDVALTMPLELAAASALVAAAHAIESTLVRTRDPISTALALASLERLAPALAAMLEEPSSREARGALQGAAIMAALAIRSARGGLQHAAAHALTVGLGVPHASAHAALLPRTLAFGADQVAGELRRIAKALAVPDAAEWARVVIVRAGLHGSLRDLGVERARLAEVADRVARDRGRLDLDPRDPDRDAVLEMLESAW